MAIIIKEKEKKLEWFPIAIGAFVLLTLGLSVYFLFLTPTPFIEKISPVEGLQSVNSFTTLNDPTTILSNSAFSSLHLYVPNPDTGQLGRDNPFLRLF